MDQDVSHGHDFIDTGNASCEFRIPPTQTVQGFADDHEAVKHGLAQPLVNDKRVVRDTRRVIGDIPRGIPDIEEQAERLRPQRGSRGFR